MSLDLIKCPLCQSVYNPAYLDQVIEHIHGIDPKVVPLAKIIRGTKAMVITKQEIETQLLEQGEFTAQFENVLMWIQLRPHYCDRGKYQWNAESTSHKITVDHADGFPRYYFLMDSLVNEINAWIEKRKQQIGERKDQATPKTSKPKEYPIDDE